MNKEKFREKQETDWRKRNGDREKAWRGKGV